RQFQLLVLDGRELHGRRVHEGQDGRREDGRLQDGQGLRQEGCEGRLEEGQLLMDLFFTIVHSHVFHGAVAVYLAAARVDYLAFQSWKSVHDAATYSWSTAGLRWAQGAVAGAVAAMTSGRVAPDVAVFGS